MPQSPLQSLTTMSSHNTINSGAMSDSDDERYEQELVKQREGKGKALGGRGATTGRAESKKRGKGGREKETEGGTEEASREREMTERGSRETDEGRERTAETKRGRRHLPSGSGSTGSGHTGVEMNLIDLSLLTKRQ